jgi:hypothetical protein
VKISVAGGTKAFLPWKSANLILETRFARVPLRLRGNRSVGILFGRKADQKKRAKL